MIRRPPRSPLFPSTTLFRSLDRPEIVDPVLDDLDRLLNRLPRALDHRGLGHREADRAAPDGGGGTIRLTVTEAAVIERTRQTIEQSIQIIEHRVNDLGTVERSEERRGGKEWRSRGSPDHSKKK